MSVRAALRDPVVKVFLALGTIPATIFALHWAFMVPVNHRYEMLMHLRKVFRAAETCRSAVSDYYGRVGRMPASETDVACPRGGDHVAPVRVASGVITISATGSLADALEYGGSGVALRLTPRCADTCTGTAIISWDCATGSTLERRYRPPICR